MKENDPIVRLPSREDEDTEEALALVFKHLEKGDDAAEAIRKKIQDELEGVLSKLEGKLIRIEKGKVKFTEQGEKQARDIIRRSRLSERLFTDVLDLRHEQLSSAACQLEHILSGELTDSICTLLGHPSECPHQNPIPQGECCRKNESRVPAVAVPLSKIGSSQSAKVLYLHFKKNPEIYRLLSLGLVPGQTIRLVQRFPTYIVQAGESQIAFDESIADHVYVRVVNG